MSNFIEEGVVCELKQGQPGTPLQVGFHVHAAIYTLHRDDPRSSEWLSLLVESLRTGAPVRFMSDTGYSRLRLVELKR